MLWLKTGDVDNYRHARFWGKLFLLNFSVGVISGFPLEFEFGTNWSRFAMVAVFCILVDNSWMQTPAGIHLENNRVVVDSYFKAIFNKNMPWGVLHMWFACLATSLFVIGGLSAWYILKSRKTDFFLKLSPLSSP